MWSTVISSVLKRSTFAATIDLQSTFKRSLQQRANHVIAYQSTDTHERKRHTSKKKSKTPNEQRPHPTAWQQEELLTFRQYIENADLKNIFLHYPKLLQDRSLEPRDSIEIIRHLHNAAKSRLMPKQDILVILQDIVKHYKYGRLPAHPRASLHILGCYRDLGKVEAGVEFWSWVVKQESWTYVNLLTYGVAIDLLARAGKDLATCEETFNHGLRRFQAGFNLYHLSAGGILPQRESPTTVPLTSTTLLSGIIRARLVHGDWLNAYLAIDTALRLHPTQPSPTIMRIVLEERPLVEAFQMYCLLSQSGCQLADSYLGILLNDLCSWQKPGGGSVMDLNIVKAMLIAIRSAHAANVRLNRYHLNAVLKGALNLLPILMPGHADKGLNEATTQTSLRLVSEVFKTFSSLGVEPGIEDYGVLIDRAGRLGMEPLLMLATDAIAASGLTLDSNKYLQLTRAYGKLRNAAQLEKSWESYTQQYGLSGPFAWATLAESTGLAGNITFLHKNMDAHGLSKKVKSHLSTVAESTKAQLGEDTAPLVEGEEGKEEKEDEEEAVIARRTEGCIENVASFFHTLSSLQILIRDGNSRDLQMFPPDRVSIVHFGSSPAREWQERLYNELTVDPGITEHLPNRTDGTMLEHMEVPQPEPPSAATSIDDTTEQSTELLPASAISPTGIPLGQLRFINWSIINDLLLQAERFEMHSQGMVDEAIRQGKPLPQSRSVRGAPNSIERRNILKRQRALYQSIAAEPTEDLTEQQWREKIIHLRRSGRSSLHST